MINDARTHCRCDPGSIEPGGVPAVPESLLRREHMKMATILLLAGLIAMAFAAPAARADEGAKKADGRVFEIRTYYAAEGKMDALHARFRDHTCKLFEKHGMTIIGFWSPRDPEQAQKKLIYILAFPSKDAAAASWKAFMTDPAWQAVWRASEKNGKLVDHIESVYVNPTDYSPTK
jgi:hypothetical protein